MNILYLPDQYSQQRQREKKRSIYPIRMAMEATYMRSQGHHVVWDDPLALRLDSRKWNKTLSNPMGIEFSKLSKPDRVFTRAMDKKWQDNGNFKYLPGTYIQSSGGCWWGRCSFCVEKQERYHVRSIESAVDDIAECESMGFREVFDDSATFPSGTWLDMFLLALKKSGVKIRLGCNMRMVNVDYSLMRHVGFRMVLFGVESANQQTLDKVNKGVSTEDVKYVIAASLAGLEPHIAVMFGYPWETDEDAIRTLRLVWFLLRKGYAKTAQASFYTVPGVKAKWWHKKYVPMIYRAAWYPDFWMNQLRSIHNADDLKYLWRSIKKGVSDVSSHTGSDSN